MLIRRSTGVVGACVVLLGTDMVVLSQYADLTIYSLIGHANIQKTSEVEFLLYWGY